MTEEKGSVLKTSLGLENLKGLGETIKKATELHKSLNEGKQALTTLLEANSPIAKAIADRLGAETLQSLKEGDMTALEELKAKLGEENQKAKEVINALTQDNQQLKEALQTQTTRQIIAEELDRRLPKGGNPGGDDKLTTAINNLVAERLNALVGGGQQSTLTAEDTRKIIGEEVAKSTQGNNSPDQVAGNIIKMLTVSDTVKQKLGISEGGIGARLLPAQGGDSGLRTDLVKVLLEDERERVKIQQHHEAEMQRNKYIGTLAETVKENLGDGIAALTAAAQEVKASGGTKTVPSPEQPQLFRCGCGTEFGPPAGWAGQPLKCPNPDCGREYTKEELLG